MKSTNEKITKPLKKVKALKQKIEAEELLLKPAVRIQELKNKLIILGHQLFVTKQINNSLYRKIQLLTYSRTTELKLKDSYKTLKQIESDLSKPNEDTTTKKPKKKTVKDFNEKKNTQEDANILYNVFLNFKV